MFRIPFFSLLAFLLFSGIRSDAEEYKQLPPKGISIDESVQQELANRVRSLRERYRAVESKDPNAWIPDIEVYARAVDLAIKQSLFFKKDQIKHANELLDDANKRLELARQGKRGLELLGWSGKASDTPIMLVGGFLSRLDDSVQPYGLVIPAHFERTNASVRLDVWLHGRGDTKTEVPFLWDRKTNVGYYSPEQSIVLHPFGRHCNAFKFAGETDIYESIDHVANWIPVDKQRISLRGFSMGGAGVWHIGVHDPTRWFAINPGAGFVDTIRYQKWTKKTPYPINETRQKLMQWYDVLPWSSNLQNTNVVAYSGEMDKQRQAAERVFAELKKQSIPYKHVVGAKMGHKIDQPSREKIDRLLSDLEKTPLKRDKVTFTTAHLRYHRAGRISVSGLEEQFVPGRIQAEWHNEYSASITTNAITHLTIDARSSDPIDLRIDGDVVEVTPQKDAKGYRVTLLRDKAWTATTDSTLRKRPGIQGPIDDAFCSRFLFVIPSRPANHGVAQRFIDREMKYAAERWRTLMRGKVRFVKDIDVTDVHLQNDNLICFGDFTSNQYLAKVADRLPFEWSKGELRVGEKRHDPKTSVLAFCFPNPENPNRYLVANSGMTFRDFSNVSNSRQIAMLPDWVVFNASTMDDGIFAGKIRSEGFFDEDWNLK